MVTPPIITARHPLTSRYDDAVDAIDPVIDAPGGPAAAALRAGPLGPHRRPHRRAAVGRASRARRGRGRARSRCVDEAGEPVTERPEVDRALGSAVRAGSAIFDGFLTKQPTADIVYATPSGDVPSPGALMAKPFIGMRRDRGKEAEAERAALAEAATFREEDQVAFVATDLLRLDGDSLLDVPLLERKRLLDSVIDPADLVRVGAYVRPPLETWIGTWRRLGLLRALLPAPPTPATTRARSTTTGPSSRCHGADTPARGCYGCLVPPTVLTPAIRDEIARLGKADIMVGIPSFKNAATIGYVVRAAQAGLVQYFPDLRPVVVNSDAGSPDGTQRVVIDTEPPDYVEQILLVRPTNRLDRVSPDLPGDRGHRRQGRRPADDLRDRRRPSTSRRSSSSTRTCARSCPNGSSSSPARSSRAATTSSRRSTPATSTTARSPTPSPTRSPGPSTGTASASRSAATSASRATSSGTTSSSTTGPTTSASSASTSG